MITIEKTLLKQINEGLESPKVLERALYKYPIDEVIKSFAELLLMADDYMNRPQIVVSEDEYKQITNLFKVRGQRIKRDGTVVEETRGRRKKQ